MPLSQPGRTVAIAALALLAPVGLAGCGAAAEKVAEQATERAIEDQTGATVDIDSGDGSVEVETEDGSFSSGTGDVPKEWPDDLPIPDGLQILSGSTFDTDEGKLVAITATSEQSAQEVFDQVADELSGWEVSGKVTTSDSAASMNGAQWELDGRRVTLSATSAPGSETSVALSHTVLA